jgi:hypothetical protein
MKLESTATRFAAIVASLGVFSLGAATLIGSLTTAHAQGLGPEITGGVHPYVSFTGTTSTGMTTVYTVPNDRILVVTAAAMNTVASLLQGATPKVAGSSNAMLTTSGAADAVLATGRGQLVFDPGSTVVINGSTTYYIQGYLAHP